MVRLDSGRIFPVSLPLVLTRATRGAYHLLVAAAQASPRGQKAVNDVSSFIGALHEEYLGDLLRRVFPAGGGATFVDEEAVVLASGAKTKPPFDGAIVAGDTLVLIEMLTATLRLDTLETGDLGLFRRDFDRDFRKKVRQLESAVIGVGKGQWVIPGVDPTKIERVVPALASLHPFPLFGAVWNIFESTFGKPSFGHNAEVLPLQLVDDEELEVLEAHQLQGTIGIVDALLLRASRSDWIHSSMGHVILRAWLLQERDNPAMLALYRAVSAEMRTAAQRIFNMS